MASTCKDLGEEFGDNIFDRYRKLLEIIFRQQMLTHMKKARSTARLMTQLERQRNGDGPLIENSVSLEESPGRHTKLFVDVMASLPMLKGLTNGMPSLRVSVFQNQFCKISNINSQYRTYDESDRHRMGEDVLSSCTNG